jgi:hypothetical protein
MLKSKLILMGLALLLCISACGIFKKDCNCPKFGQVKTTAKPAERA